MLAAIGATEKQVRLVLLVNGAVVGAIAAVVGTAVGLGAWIVFAPTLESAVDHRVDRLSLQWWLVATTGLLALLGATAAAWWPGRAAARLSVVLALSGRPPKPRPARHSAIAAASLIALGVALLALSNRHRPALVVAGIVATILGALLLGPLAIRIFSSLAGRVSIAPRLAPRDLVRFQARSGAALAAVTLAVGIAASVVASAEAARRRLSRPRCRTDRFGSTSPHRKRPGSSPRSARVPGFDACQRMFEGSPQGSTRQRCCRWSGSGNRACLPWSPAIPASSSHSTPRGGRQDVRPRRAALRRHAGGPPVPRHRPATIDRRADFLVDRSALTSGLVIPSMKERGDFAVTNVQRIELGEHRFGSAIEASQRAVGFITPDGLRRHGWTQMPAGWLVESKRPLTSDQVAAARRVAADAGLAVEVEESAGSNAKIMGIATAAGATLALAILAMTVGLIRSEAAGDLRTLTATGATSRIRRTLTASTAGALAFLGALLGVAGAYVVLVATSRDDLGYLGDPPFLYLALALVGVPLAAGSAGWLLSGREPPTLARAVIE
jgi:putative ABC transport system permease protein